MKTIKYITTFAIVLFFATFALAETTTKTESVKVSGNCGMCKERIETAAKIPGVTKADWDKSTKMLTLVYNPAVVKVDDVQKKVAAAGHDTGKYKAEAKTYDGLPGCCKYR